jgi:hypothetical protein
MNYRRASNVLVIAFLVFALLMISPTNYMYRIFGYLSMPLYWLVGGVIGYILIYRFDLDRHIVEGRQ